MQWLRQLNYDRFLTALYLAKLWLFDRPLKRIEKIEIRTPLKGDCGIDATIWQRNGNWYFYLVTAFHGGFPEDWKAPESSTVITPAMYIDVLQRYLEMVSYVERLNTGESQPETFMLLEDLTPHPSDDITEMGENV